MSVALRTQIIKRKVDPEKLTGAYYQQVRHDIKRKIKGDTELLIIQILPTNTITEKWIVEAFMYLQRIFTSFITIPQNSADMNKEDFEEFERMYDCSILLNK